MSKGVIVGEVEAPVTRLAGLKRLFNPTYTSRTAVRTCLHSFQRKQTGRALVRLKDAVHVAAFIPTGGGKGQSLILPFLAEVTESFCLFDPKGEAARLLADDLRRRGFRVVLLDPFRSVTDTPDRLNPLSTIPADDAVLDACRSAADEIVEQTGRENDPFWGKSTKHLLASEMAFTCLFADPARRNLQTVRDLVADFDKYRASIEVMTGSTELGGLLARAGHTLAAHKDKELASVLSTVHAHTAFLDTPAIAESTRDSTFDPRDLTRERMAVFIVLPPAQMAAQAGWLRLTLGTLLRAVVAGGLQEKNLVHFLIDEAGALGHMPVLEQAVTVYRGYGCRCQFFYQNLGQLKSCWPDGKDQILLGNSSQLFVAVNDPQTAQYVSDRLGDGTIVVRSGGTGTSRSGQSNPDGKTSLSYSSSTSDNWSYLGRKLLKPDEVMQSHPRVVFCFHPGATPDLGVDDPVLRGPAGTAVRSAAVRVRDRVSVPTRRSSRHAPDAGGARHTQLKGRSCPKRSSKS